MATITAPVARRHTAADSRMLMHVDVVLLALPLAISALGLLMIYDSSRNRLAADGLSKLYYVERQGLAIGLGLVAMLVVMFVDYRRIRDLWAVAYVLILPVLAGVIVLGRNHKG